MPPSTKNKKPPTIESWRQQKHDVEHAQAVLASLYAEAKSWLAEQPTQSVEYHSADEGQRIKVKATLVSPTGSTLDTTKLRKALGAKVFDSLTKPVLDQDLLKAAIAEGRVSANVVATCMTEAPKAPYIRLTETELTK